MAKRSGDAGSGSTGRRFTRFGGQAADWGSVDADTIRQTIEAASAASGAIRFGYSSDGGAYALGVYGDGDKPYTEFVRPSENIEGVLKDLETLFLDIKRDMDAKPRKQP